MKILFVLVKEDYIDPMNVELLSAQAKMAGHETFLNVLEHNDLRPMMESVRPDVVAYSAKTGESRVFFRVNRWLKETYKDSITTIMGGPHATFNHTQMRLYQEDLRAEGLIEDTALDIIAVGEADEAWPMLLKRMAANESYDDVPNLVTKTNRHPEGKVTMKDRTNFLDDLPFLDRELIYSRTRLKDFGMRSFMASRGCPFLCTYCFNAKFNQLYRGKGKTVNRYSVDRLIAELQDMVRRHPTQFIKFYDDVFTFRSDAWLEDFADKYKREINLPFHCLTRADLVKRDPRMLELLKKAGIKSLSMSIESGNPFLREHVLKRGMDSEDIRIAFELSHKLKINTFSNTILAIPAPILAKPDAPYFEEHTRALVVKLKDYFKVNPASLPEMPEGKLTMVEKQRVSNQLQELGLRHRALDYDIDSVDINIDNKVVFGEFPELFPYPGTPITQYVIDVGAFDGNFEKLHQNYQSESPFDCFTPEEKRQQVNLSLLAMFLLIVPSLRKFSYKYLLNKPWTRFYFLLYFFSKAYLIAFKIYPMRYGARYIFRTIKESFLTERLKHSKEEGEEFYEKRAVLNRPTSEVLGGPWQS